MHAALRRYATAAIAVAGAGAIAVTPVAPPPPAADLHIASPAVQLTAAANPLQFYQWVKQETLLNAGGLLQQYLTVPFQLGEAIITQPLPTLGAVFTTLANPATYLIGAWSLINPAVSAITASVAAVTDVIHAVAASDPIDLFNAIVNIPGWILTGVFQGAWIPGNVNLGGFLTRYRTTGSDGGLYLELPGLLGFPLYLAQQILNAVLPAPSAAPLAAVNELPEPGATMLTLNTGPAVDNGSTPILPYSRSGPMHEAQQELGAATAEAASTNDPTTSAPDSAPKGAETATNQPTDPVSDASTQVQRGLDPPVAEAAHATDGLIQMRSRTSIEGQRGLDAAAASIDSERSDTRDGNKVQPGQEGKNSAPSGGDAVKTGGDAVKTDKPVGDEAEPKPS